MVPSGIPYPPEDPAERSFHVYAIPSWSVYEYHAGAHRTREDAEAQAAALRGIHYTARVIDARTETRY